MAIEQTIVGAAWRSTLFLPIVLLVVPLNFVADWILEYNRGRDGRG